MKLLVWLAMFMVLFTVYVWKVRPLLRSKAELKPLYDKLDNIRASLWTRINARLATWRTIILGFIGAFIMAMPDLLENLLHVDWGAFFEAGYVRMIGAGIYIMMILTRIASPGAPGSVPDITHSGEIIPPAVPPLNDPAAINMKPLQP